MTQNLALSIPVEENNDFQGYVAQQLISANAITPTASTLYDLCDRHPKSLPRFSGSATEALVEDWFDVAEQYADNMGWTDTMKLSQLVQKLTYEAKDFHQSTLASVDCYPVWKASLIEQFTSKNKQYYMKLWEDGLYQKEDQSVTMFAIQVRSVYAKAFGLKILMTKKLYKFRINEKINAFVKGLIDPEVRKEINDFLARVGKRRLSWRKVVEHSENFQRVVELKNLKRRSKSSAGDGSGYTRAYIATSASPQDQRASFGVFFPKDDLKNIGELMDEKCQTPTCNRAILYGALQAIKAAKKAGIRRLEICSNSKYLLDSLSCWAFAWLKRDWKKSDGTLVKNSTYWRDLIDALTGMEIKLGEIKCKADKLDMIQAKKLAISARLTSAQM